MSIDPYWWLHMEAAERKLVGGRLDALAVAMFEKIDKQ